MLQLLAAEPFGQGFISCLKRIYIYVNLFLKHMNRVQRYARSKEERELTFAISEL